MYSLKIKEIGDITVITGIDRRPLDPIATGRAVDTILEKSNLYLECKAAQEALLQTRLPAKTANGKYNVVDWQRWVDEKEKKGHVVEEKSAELIEFKKELFSANKKYAPLRRGEVEYDEDLAKRFNSLKATESLTSKGEVLPNPIVVLEVEETKGKMTPEDKVEMKTQLIGQAEEQAVRLRMLSEIKGNKSEEAIKEAKAFLDGKIAQIEGQFIS